MKLVLRLFGIPVFTIDVEGFFITEEEQQVEEEPRIEGGSAHDFERDCNPVTPEDRYNWEWEDRRGFGFG